MDEKSKPTFTGGLASFCLNNLISKHLIKKSAFFNFFLEIEQIIAIFAPAIMPDMGLLKLKKKKDSRLIREDKPAF